MNTASIVLYHNPAETISKLLNCLSSSVHIDLIYLIDNSQESTYINFSEFKKIIYIKSKNVGYGAGHNIALRKILKNSEFHFVINPDVYFDPADLEKMIFRCRQNENIGLLMPKVLYPDGSLQYLCKKLPSPVDLILRRLNILNSYNNFNYELRFANYDQEMNIPNLSGCFMLLRVSALTKIGLFDERYFMYAEDMDLTRRIHSEYVTLYYPFVSIVHLYNKESYRNIKLLLIHINSLIKYFFKWGWFIDKKRDLFNMKVVNKYSNNI